MATQFLRMEGVKAIPFSEDRHLGMMKSEQFPDRAKCHITKSQGSHFLSFLVGSDGWVSLNVYLHLGSLCISGCVLLSTDIVSVRTPHWLFSIFVSREQCLEQVCERQWGLMEYQRGLLLHCHAGSAPPLGWTSGHEAFNGPRLVPQTHLAHAMQLLCVYRVGLDTPK